MISLTRENVSLQLLESASGFILQKGRLSFLYILTTANNNSILAAMCQLTENSNANCTAISRNVVG